MHIIPIYGPDEATQIKNILSLGRFRVFNVISENNLDTELGKIGSPSQFAYINVYNEFILGMYNNYQNGFGVQLKCTYSSSHRVMVRDKYNGTWSAWIDIV